RVDVAIRQAGEADLAVGIVAAEILQKVVIDAQALAGRLVVFEPRHDAENAEDDLGIDAVLFHLLDAQVRVAGPRLAALTGVVRAGSGNLADPVVLPGHELTADRADAAPPAHIDAALCHPARPVRALLDIRHPVLHLAAGL